MEEQVTTLARLVELSKEKRSVCTKNNIHWFGFKYKPAAFVINMSGYMIFKLIEKGLYVYEKKEKRND